MRQKTRKFAVRSAHQFWRERLAMVIGVALIFFISVFGEVIGLITGYIASGFAITGQLTAGDFLALLGLYESVRGSAGDFGGLWVKLQGAVASLRRVFFFIDTVLDRSGDTLSVGQQQRLSIARGLVRDSKILILDEPTAALDPRTENALVRALHTTSGDRLVIVIARRLSTIRRASRIVFIEDGEIRDIGDHDTLMANPDGSYRRYVELQTG